MADKKTTLIQNLAEEISKDTGNLTETEISTVTSHFSQIINKALQNFNSQAFDEEGFVKKLKMIDFGDKKNKDMVKNVLNSIKNEYVDAQTLNHSEILMRRDLFNVCTQMPELRDVVYLMRDAIIESNVSTGEVSRSILFYNHDDSESYESHCKDLENKYKLLMAIKNFIVPRTLMVGEFYVHVVPYAKLFAELEAVTVKNQKGRVSKFRESIPNNVFESFKTSKSLYSEENLSVLMESVSSSTKVDLIDDYKIQTNKMDSFNRDDQVSKANLKSLLENIQVYNGSSLWLAEMGAEGFQEFLFKEYKENKAGTTDTHFSENFSRSSNDIFGKIKEEDIDYDSYSNIKGCYVKYLDSLRLIPIKLDRRIIGYYYVTTTMDLQVNPAQPNGIVDLSFQHYTRDKNLVDRLCNILIQSFDKELLKKNVNFKNELAEIVMAHRFSEGRLSFVFIPENEVVRFVINEDESGRGHSIIEPSLFNARLYLMLTLYNVLYVLNNNMTRVHYVKSSGLDKNYSSQIQRTIRKYQSRKITIDDIYSYQGVLNKVGGRGEMILPAGRGDYKAIETDTLPAADNPIPVEFLDHHRRQAISGTGTPYLMSTNAIDEVDFAKTMELANTRFLSTVSSYKIDFNNGITELYHKLLKYNTDLDDNIIQSMKFMFHTSKQQELNINNDMISNFNTMVELIATLYYSQDQLTDKDGKPTPFMKHLKKELAMKYLPQFDFDELDQIVDRVNLKAIDDKLEMKINNSKIEQEDIDKIVDQKE